MLFMATRTALSINQTLARSRCDNKYIVVVVVVVIAVVAVVAAFKRVNTESANVIFEQWYYLLLVIYLANGPDFLGLALSSLSHAG